VLRVGPLPQFPGLTLGILILLALSTLKEESWALGRSKGQDLFTIVAPVSHLGPDQSGCSANMCRIEEQLQTLEL
jgi:hypothetical protein